MRLGGCGARGGLWARVLLLLFAHFCGLVSLTFRQVELGQVVCSSQWVVPITCVRRELDVCDRSGAMARSEVPDMGLREGSNTRCLGHLGLAYGLARASVRRASERGRR